MNRKIVGWVVLVAVVVVGVVMYLNRQELIAIFFEPTESSVESGQLQSDSITVAADNLTTPWSIQHLPGGDMLVSERRGQLKRIGQAGAVYDIEGVRETSEGGLLGVALHPNFADNELIYLYYTTDRAGGLTNQIDRAKLSGDRLSDQATILDGIPAAANHNGGAIEFGPDGKLYVTTGDAAQEELAQDKQSLAGKILRLNPDGTVPADNPFDNLVWSYGHRNPQGITWDSQGRMWSVEHGPSGVQSGRDELNQIEAGVNYGWPEISGDETAGGMRSPVLQSGDEDTWAPARMVYAEDKLYFTGLRGQSLYEVAIDDDQPTIKKYLNGDYGRLRALATGGQVLYIGTSNRDGRGSASFGNDKILSLPLTALSSGD